MTLTIQRLAQANHAVEQLIADEVRELGLTHRQTWVLLSLQTTEGKTAAEIGRELGVEKTTIAHVVRRMVKMKLLKQKARKNDGRAEENYLTKAGADKAKALLRVAIAVERELTRITNNQSQGMITQLTQIAALWTP